MATNFTFFGQFGGVTRQCSLCKELLVVNASSSDLRAGDAHHIWSSAFEKHIQERHSAVRPDEDQESCPTVRILM